MDCFPDKWNFSVCVWNVENAKKYQLHQYHKYKKLLNTLQYWHMLCYERVCLANLLTFLPTICRPHNCVGVQNMVTWINVLTDIDLKLILLKDYSSYGLNTLGSHQFDLIWSSSGAICISCKQILWPGGATCINDKFGLVAPLAFPHFHGLTDIQTQRSDPRYSWERQKWQICGMVVAKNGLPTIFVEFVGYCQP